MIVAPAVATLVGAWLVVALVTPGISGGSDATPKPSSVLPDQFPAAAAGVPFTIATRGQDHFACSYGWMVARPPTDIPAPSSYADYEHWMVGTGAVISDYGGVLLTIQGTTLAEVVLTSLQVQVVNRAPAVRGTHVYEHCGGSETVRVLDVNLDHDPPTYQSIIHSDLAGENGSAWETTPLTFPYSVSITDAETFYIVANTFRCDCQWRIKLAWASQGATGTMVIDDHGKPFRTSGDHNATGDCTTSEQSGLTCGPPTPAPGETP